ncbi:ABATE domain-containing protein [Streptomyces sp. MS1.AVA.1]|uniref:ABATE domain-containing protein n=1 Tax=Streptomyces machairae TaxID=3134109 RepID=A0ABU8ULM8_9ACTN
MSDPVPLTGEPLALDLVNTRTAVGDLLTTPSELRAWWELQADRLPEDVPREGAGVTAADLAAVLAVREHAARALGHVRRGEQPRPPTWRHSTTRSVPRRRSTSWPGTGRRWSRRSGARGRRDYGWRPASPRPPPNCWPIRRSPGSASARPTTA